QPAPAAEGSGGAAGSERPTPSGQLSAKAAAGALVLVLGAGLPLGSGCDSQSVDRAFTRRAPDVDRGIEALEARDAGAAARYFTNYLGTGPCNNGAIGSPPALAERPQA